MSCGSGEPADEIVAALDVIAFLHVDDLRLRHQIFDRIRPIVGDDRDLALCLIVLLEADLARDLGDDRIFLGLAGFEQLRDARQTAGDVAGPGGFARHTRQHFAGFDRLAVLDRDDRARGEAINARLFIALAHHGQAGTKVLLLRLGEVVDHRALRDAGRLVGLLDQGAVLDQVLDTSPCPRAR